MEEGQSQLRGTQKEAQNASWRRELFGSVLKDEYEFDNRRTNIPGGGALMIKATGV